MNSQDKNTMTRNLRTFIEKGKTGLRDYQDDVLIAVEKFMRLPNGAEFTQLGSKETEEKGVKKGDYLEVVSATGSGKTRMFGTMAKAMDVPTLIVTPRNLLNKKTREEFCDEIGIAEKDIAIYDSHQPPSERRRILEGNPPPKFLITSYQSLPPLVDRHELDFTNRNDVHYRPLVILDEVHEAQGQKTSSIIKKLRNNVLVAGFTATDAGAASYLFEGQKPVYHLPITEAIKRDILCNGVVTGTIDVTIDEGWITNFSKTQKGREYRREDLERFAAAPSVLEGAIRFHLTENRDDFGKLSRLPTVFYTEGVGSARYGAARFNALAEELGVNAKAAYVSGDMGLKQYQPILEQFKKGEIQAVFNDKLLGMGFDARNATVCYSLRPSNMPHVVEQQLGRITRKQDSDYKKKYGQDKLSLAINVRAEGMDPYLFGQVLGDAGVYSEKYVRSPVTWVTKKVVGKDDIEATTPDETPKTALVDAIDVEPQVRSKRSLPSGIKVHIDYKDMQSVISEANKNREGIPQKTDEWLYATEMGNLSRISVPKMYLIYESLKAEWQKAKDNGETHFTAEGITIPVDKAGIFQSGSIQPFCLHKDLVSHFSTPEKTEDFLAAHEMGRLAHANREKMYAMYEALETAWRQAKENGEIRFTAEGITLPIEKAGIFQNVSKSAFCLHKDTVSLFSVSAKTPEWLNATEMREVAHTSDSIIYPLYRKLKTSWQEAREKGEANFTAEGITLPVNKAGIFQNGPSAVFCLHKDTTSNFSTPQKPEDFFNSKEATKIVHCGNERTAQIYDEIKASWLEAKSSGRTSFTVESVTIPIDKVGIFQNYSSKSFYIHKDILNHFSKPPKTKETEALPSKTIYPKKTDDFLNIEEMGESARTAPKTISKVYEALEKSWEDAKKSGEANFTATDITLPVDKAGIFQSGSRSSFCLHKDAVSYFSTPQKTKDFLATHEMAELTGSVKKMYSIYRSLAASWQKAKEEGETSFTAEGITLPIDKAGIFQNHNKRPFCVHRDMAENIAAYLKNEKSSQPTFTEMIGDKKSISPDSEHIKRTGRVRGG